jgi:hypothetical protein
MKTLQSGTEAQEVPDTVQKVLDEHKEVVLIIADPDGTYEGETKIAVFSKLQDSGGIITPMLDHLLRNLLATANGKQCCNLPDEAPTSAETHCCAHT